MIDPADITRMGDIVRWFFTAFVRVKVILLLDASQAYPGYHGQMSLNKQEESRHIKMRRVDRINSGSGLKRHDHPQPERDLGQLPPPVESVAAKAPDRSAWWSEK